MQSAMRGAAAGSIAATPGCTTPHRIHLASRCRCRATAAPDATVVGPLIRVAVIDSAELMEIARLRAEAFHEDQSSRYKQSFIKQFADQEYRRLAGATSGSDAATALAAVDDQGRCIGTLDVRPNYTPDCCPPGAYVANVVVAPQLRGRGLGKKLVEAAKQYAASQFSAQLLYAHVEAANDVASHLYMHCGFTTVSVEGGVESGSVVGSRILLQCKLV